MIDRYEVLSSDSPRPRVERVVFCDGAGGRWFRAETDLDLSHWRPNRTPTEYRAGTSTEICFRFLENPLPGPWAIAVNNHVDVDGILSVYVLVHSDHALTHRQTIIEAAEMGDFWGWGDWPAQLLFQGITQLINKGGDPKSGYDEAINRIPSLIDGSHRDAPSIRDSLAPLREGVEHVEQGRITRRQIDIRLTQYVVPLALPGNNDAQASYVPEFNELISPKAVLWPHVRARWDPERACLVCVERPAGWFHTLWLPGYLWADTEGKWLVPGFIYHDGMTSYHVQNDQLTAVFEDLQQEETAVGRWALGGTQLPLGDELQQKFPLVGGFFDSQGEVTTSRLSPHRVARAFGGRVFTK